MSCLAFLFSLLLLTGRATNCKRDIVAINVTGKSRTRTREHDLSVPSLPAPAQRAGQTSEQTGDIMSTFSPRPSLLPLVLVLSSMVQANIDLRSSVFHTDLVNISQIRLTGDNFIHIGLILTNVLGKTKHFQNNLTVEFQMFDKKSKMLTQFEKMLQSIFLYSRGSPLHFIFITDEESLPIIENSFKQEIGRYLSESLINKTPIKNQLTIFMFPKLSVEFVDIHSITSGRKNSFLSISFLI